MNQYLLVEQFIEKSRKDDLIVLFHSGIASDDQSLSNGIEGQFGDWLKDVLKNATDDEEMIEQISSETQLAFFDELPQWVSIKVANHLKTSLDKLTIESIIEHGQLCIVAVEPNDHDFHRAGDRGDDFVEYSTYLDGENTYETLPFGVEPGDVFSTASYNPVDMTLTGNDLITFLKRNYPVLNHLNEIASRREIEANKVKPEKVNNVSSDSFTY